MAKYIPLNWTSTVWRICFLILSTHCNSCIALRNTYWTVGRETLSYDVYPDNNTVSWWEAAQNGCGQGRLYLPRNLNIPRTDLNQLQKNHAYWVGAMEYSTWKWNDGTHLYTYVGYRRITEEGSFKAILNDNSAFKCHLQCKNAKQIGMRGRECYCLSGEADYQSENPELRCPGNYEEKCGNEEGVSVYKTDNLIMPGYTVEPKENGQCVYATLSLKLLALMYTLNVYQDDDCETRRSAVCHSQSMERTRDVRCRNTICVSRSSYSWAAANRTCSLMKITDSNKDDLKRAMKFSAIPWKRYSYWIGLKRIYSRRWLNGSQVLLQTEKDSGAERLCLAVYFLANREITYKWELCSKKLKPICEQRSISTSASTQHPLSTSLQPTDSDGSHRTTTSNIYPTDSVVIEEELKANSYHYNSHKGAALGTSAALIVVLVSIFATLIVIYRKKKLCFRTKEPLIFANLEETPNNLVPHDHRAHDIYLTAVHNNRATTSFINNGCSGGESFNAFNKRKEHENEYICLSGSNGKPHSNAAAAVRGACLSGSSEYVEADVRMGGLFSQSRITSGPNSTGQNLNESEYILAGQTGHVSISCEGNDAYDHTADSKHPQPQRSDRMYDHTMSSPGQHGEVEYDMAGEDRTRGLQYNETYNRTEKGCVLVTGVATGDHKAMKDGDKNIYTNYSTKQDDHIYGNEQNLESPPENVYCNINLAENPLKPNK